MVNGVDASQVILENKNLYPGYGCAEFHCIPQRVPGADESHPVRLKIVNSKLHFTHPVSII